MTRTPPVCPRGHGPMAARTRSQTPEQEWCGTWWDCQQCTSSCVETSHELRAQLAEQAKR